MDRNAAMINIFVFAFNRPDLLELQVECFKKFLTNDFNVYVIHDTRNNQYVNDFQRIVENLKNKYPQNQFSYHIHESPIGMQSSEYHSESLQWTYDSIVKSLPNSIALFVDHDMFLIEDLDLEKYIESYDIVGLLQERGHINYIWPGLVAFKIQSFNDINWKCGNIEGQPVDSGGGTYTILRDKTIRYKNTGADYPNYYKDIDLTNTEITHGYNFELHFEGKFLHTRNASNWDTMYNVKDQTKTNLLNQVLKDVLKTEE